MPAPRTVKQQQDESAKKIQTRMLTIIGVVAIIGILACGYGHAALSTKLLISGEATVKAELKTFGITYMQEMTPAICSAAKVGIAQQLIDKRDNQPYWVRKMENGDCWMTQNLNLHITTTGLTSELTDMYADSAADAGWTAVTKNGKTIYVWDQGSTYPPSNTFDLSNGSNAASVTNSSSTTYSWYYGNYVLKTNALTNTAACTTTRNLQTCPGRIVEVTGMTPTWSYNESGTTVNDEGTEYDSHYLYGHLYQFNTATAGAGATATNTIINSTICPRGWTIPNASGTFSMANMLTSEFGGSAFTKGWYAPTYVIRTGYVLPTGILQYAYEQAFYWTRNVTAANSVTSYMATPQQWKTVATGRARGYGVRCVARKTLPEE